MQVSGCFGNSVRVERQAPPPHPSPLKGEGVGGGVGLAAAKPSREEMAEWVRLNLPICSAFAAAFRSEFGDVRMSSASEAGHTIGKPVEAALFSVSGEALMAHKAKRAAP